MVASPKGQASPMPVRPRRGTLVKMISSSSSASASASSASSSTISSSTILDMHSILASPPLSNVINTPEFPLAAETTMTKGEADRLPSDSPANNFTAGTPMQIEQLMKQDEIQGDGQRQSQEEIAKKALTGALASVDDKKKKPRAVAKALLALRASSMTSGADVISPFMQELEEKASNYVTSWRVELKIGDEIDAKSFREGRRWYKGCIDSETTEGVGGRAAGPPKWVVRFKAYRKDFNECYEKTSVDLMPFDSQPKHNWGHYVTKRKSEEQVAVEEERARKRAAAERNPLLEKKEAVIIAITKYGRSVKATIGSSNQQQQQPAVKQPPLLKRQRESSDASSLPTLSSIAAASDSTDSTEGVSAVEEDDKDEESIIHPDGGGKAGFANDTGGKDCNDWACGTCHELERDGRDRLVLCDGSCKRSFHQSCLGLSTAEVDALEEWVCEQCQDHEHACFVCGDMAKDGLVGGVHKCQSVNCGKFYHQHCVSQLTMAQILKKQDEAPMEETEEQQQSGNVPFQFKFICPLHLCDVCGKGKEPFKYRKKLHPCWHCPKAYHENCIPPTSKYHEYLLLCPEHCHHELPHLPGWGEDSTPSSASSSAAETDATPDVGKIKTQGEGWLSAVLTPYLPRKVIPFKMVQPIFDAVNNKPRAFGHIPGLKYLCKIPPIPPGPECQCIGHCGDTCLNRVLHIECVGSASSSQIEEGSSSGGGAGGKKERYHNCNVGPDCGNRAFKNKEYVKHQIFKEYGCGWGLRTLENVKKGQLVFEYVGEVIDDAELTGRMEEHSVLHPNDYNMYIMELENGVYLDARQKGNSSRFINHSCDPNCELQKWNVKGMTHIGIMAIDDMPKGTPLSYDYQFATNDESKFKCNCGAVNCRGSLAPKAKTSEEATMEALRNGSRTDRKKLIEICKKREKREQARKEQLAEQSRRKRNLTSHLLPGDPCLEVKAGPQLRFKLFAKGTRIFLNRNVRVGYNFLRRRDLMHRKAARLQQQQASSSVGSASAGVGAAAVRKAGEVKQMIDVSQTMKRKRSRPSRYQD